MFARKKLQPCKEFACAIQDCLRKNDFQEEECTEQILKLAKCCVELHKNGLKSDCCPKDEIIVQIKENMNPS
ncbi:Cx9C motif-containing protein 4, mitochondrial [Zancudomyces culisetae]|uniref:Cx9C motif-containing protein 4, mitochondrial n=1 Tax=Zancudomyces culisetae TaxID=1213189 RepID=A0A1R1PW31_ZANCU|nr:Cx9C motif-containing protein 4, mitochondrial [Zancudomyces culisetae]|eukprot:OMH85158.1 Cx9C motif-containing protein 4, mitochondrial [Zancudomyces culisetae]